MTCESCRNEDRIKALEQDSLRNQQTHKEFFSKFEESRTADAVTQERYQQILQTMSEVKEDVKALKEKPAKRWEQVINIVLQWAILGLLAAVTLLK